MSRVERVGSLLRQIEQETCKAFDEHTELLNENRRLKAENAKLRDVLDKWHLLTAGIELPEYPITKFHPKDLERENAKLRELVNDMWICISHGSEGWDCTGCRRDPDNICIMGISEFSQRMRELGIEVNG